MTLSPPPERPKFACAWDLPEPALRLYLIAKGRKEGVTACNRGHMDETHGDEYYWAHQHPEGVLVRRSTGRQARSNADGRVVDCRSRLANLNHHLKSVVDAKKAHMDADPEGKATVHIQQELDEKAAVHREKIEAVEKELSDWLAVPGPVYDEWLMRV